METFTEQDFGASAPPQFTEEDFTSSSGPFTEADFQEGARPSQDELRAEKAKLAALPPANVYTASLGNVAKIAADAWGLSAGAVAKGLAYAGAANREMERLEQPHALPKSATELREETKQSPFYQAGDVATKFYEESLQAIPEDQQSSVMGQLAQTAGGLGLVATGPAAPLAFALSSIGDQFDAAYAEALADGKTPEDAAEFAGNRALISGAKEAAVWGLGPRGFRAVIGERISNAAGKAAGTSWLAKRVLPAAASGIEVGALSGVSAAGQNVIEGKPVLQDVGTHAVGGFAVGGLLGTLHSPSGRPQGEEIQRVPRPDDDALPPAKPAEAVTTSVVPEAKADETKTTTDETASAAPQETKADETTTTTETDAQRMAREQREASQALGKLKAEEALASVRAKLDAVTQETINDPLPLTPDEVNAAIQDAGVPIPANEKGRYTGTEAMRRIGENVTSIAQLDALLAAQQRLRELWRADMTGPQAPNLVQQISAIREAIERATNIASGRRDLSRPGENKDLNLALDHTKNQKAADWLKANGEKAGIGKQYIEEIGKAGENDVTQEQEEGQGQQVLTRAPGAVVIRRSDFKTEEDWQRAVDETEQWASDPNQFKNKTSPSLYDPWLGVLQVVPLAKGFAVEYAGQRVGYGATEEAAIRAAEETHRNFRGEQLQISGDSKSNSATTDPSTGRAVKKSEIVPRKTTPQVTVEPRHLEAARDALKNEDVPPDIYDDIDAVTRGPVRFGQEDHKTYLDQAKELSKTKRGRNIEERTLARRRMSATEGRDADKVLEDLARSNPAYADWTVDDLARAMLDHADVRLNRDDPNRPDVQRLARQMAEDEWAAANGEVQLPEGGDWTDGILGMIDKGIAATNVSPRDFMGRSNEFFSALPVWATKAVMNGALRIMREVIVRGGQLADAIAAGVKYLREQKLPGFNEDEAHQFLTENVRPRKFNAQLERAAGSGEVTPEMFASVENRLYQRKPQEPVIEAASRAIELAGGAVEAIKRWDEMTNGIAADEKVALGTLLIRQLAVAEKAAAARGDEQLARDLMIAGQEFYDKTFAAVGTDLGRGVAMFNAFMAMSPRAKFLWGRNRIERARQAVTNLVAPDVKASADAMATINAQGIETTTAAPDVQQAARTATDAAVQQTAETPGTELRNAIRKEVLDELVKAGLMTPREAEITALHLDGSGTSSLVEKLQSAGLADPATRAKKILEQLGIKMKAATSKAAGKGKVKNPQTDVEKAAAQLIREQKLKLSRIIRQHYTQQDAAGRTLADKLVSEAGLSGEQAAKLAEAVRKRFAALATRAKEAALARLLKPIRHRDLQKPGLAQRIIEATNAGQLSQEQYWNVVKERLRLPEWSADVSDDVQRRVNDIEAIPDSQRDRKLAATQQLMTALDKANGYTLLDLGQSFFITNLMFGYATHKANTLGNTLNAAGAAAAEGMQLMLEGRPLDAMTAMEAIFRGRNQTAGNIAGVLGTGQTPAMRALLAEPSKVIEASQFGRKGGVPLREDTRAQQLAKRLLESRLAGVLNAWKANGRALAAEDLLFFTPAYQAKLAILTTRMYRQQGMSGRAARQKAAEVLGFGQVATENAQQQATREGYEGPALWRRTAEILEENVPQHLRDTARDYALRTTLNNEPYGVLGALAQSIQKLKTNESPAIRAAATAVAPIINVPVNWFNESLNYSPVGFARVLGKTAYGKKAADLTPEQWRDLKAEVASKAALGTMLLAGLALKYWPRKDDQDAAPVAIYGSGPMSPADREGWKARGNIPYSIRVGNQSFTYILSPFAVPLSIVANMMDRYRDAHLYKVPAAERVSMNGSLLAGYSLAQAGATMLDQSFMLGISDLMETLREPNPERAANKLATTLARAGTSVVIPQEIRAIDKRLDPRVYHPQDAAAALAEAVPFIRREGQPALNGLGQEVTWPPSKRFSSELVSDPVTRLLANLGAWPSLPDRHEKYTWLGGKEPTDEQFAEYVKRSGKYANRMLAGVADDPQKLIPIYGIGKTSIPLSFMVELTKEPDLEERKRMVQRAAIGEIFQRARTQARKELGWEP